MRFPALFVAPLLALPTPACAQTPAPTATDADPALWVVKDKDTTIYLFGTVHVLKPGLTWFDEAVKTAFDKSDELRLEMVTPDAATAQAAVARLIAELVWFLRSPARVSARGAAQLRMAAACCRWPQRRGKAR